jgi:predicted secreted protein
VPNDKVPHGIRYSLTLHDRNNVRVLGYDNAHGIKPKKKKFGAKKTEWDHRHEKNRVESYEFENAAQLLVDFWNDVNRIMKEK